jgi:hypothetical protein
MNQHAVRRLVRGDVACPWRCIRRKGQAGKLMGMRKRRELYGVDEDGLEMSGLLTRRAVTMVSCVYSMNPERSCGCGRVLGGNEAERARKAHFGSLLTRSRPP